MFLDGLKLVQQFLALLSKECSALLSTECSVSYCDHVRRPSVHNFLVNTLASTNINKSSPNFVKMYMTIRSCMSSIMGQIEPEHPELFALEFGKSTEYDIVYALSSTDIDQSEPNLVKLCVTTGSQMRLIMDLIGLELSELSALEIENLPYLTLFTL